VRGSTGGEVVFTFSGAVDPASILAGWDGSTTAVVVRIAGAGTIVLGTLTGTSHRVPSAKTMVWTTPPGTATESGHPDLNV
jgi:disulfide bond formation protein DsbB